VKKTRAASHTEEQGKVKLMLDAYSRLGYFGGISAEFADRGFLEKLTLTSGVAMSRSLFTQSDGTYSPLYEFPDGSVGSIWNRSDLWKLSLPFRYGMDLSFSMRTPYLSSPERSLSTRINIFTTIFSTGLKVWIGIPSFFQAQTRLPVRVQPSPASPSLSI
jgi:hypothetical protein